MVNIRNPKKPACSFQLSFLSFLIEGKEGKKESTIIINLNFKIMSDNVLEIETQSEYKLEEMLDNHIKKHGVESLESVYGRAISDYYDEQFQDSLNAKRLPDSHLDQFKDNAHGAIKYDHARLFEKEDGGKLLVSQPYDISADTLKSYMKFADDNNLRLEISNKYSAWYPGKAVTVMFRTK